MTMKKHKTITRRDFLRGTVYTALGATLSSNLESNVMAGEKVKIVLIRDENGIDPQGQRNQKILQKILDDGVCELLGEEKPVQAWRRLIKPSDIVGIKSN